MFLSIGYAACHWCHVMAHESFEDQATADFLNANFVAIKVDREERPDVDAVYMAATQAISGEGGWPMSVFLTPRRPRVPCRNLLPAPAHARPALVPPGARGGPRSLAGTPRARRTERRVPGARMAESQLAAAVRLTGSPEPLDAELLSEAVRVLARSEDPDDGGFGAAPKFPPSPVLEFLVRHAAVVGDRGGGPGHGGPHAGRDGPFGACSTSSTAASPGTP